MAQTMRRTISNPAMGLALLLLAPMGTLHAQVNPATVKNQAQSGVNQAQQTNSATQAQGQSQNGRQGTGVQSNPPAKPPATPPQQPPKKPATNNAATQKQKNPPPKPAQTPGKKPASTTTTTGRPTPPPVRRDPFVTLVGKHQGGSEGEMVRLPPGKAGLQVNTLVIQGILSSPSGMIAVVANPQRSVYFLHAGDELFDGRVERIDIDGVTFHEVGKDAFGNPTERQVIRKMNPSLGEQP